MLVAQPPRHSMEETARRGQEIYLRDVMPAVGETHKGQYAAIDIETGLYEVDEDDYTATENLLIRQPNAQIWLARVGFAAAFRIGGPRSAVKDAVS